MFDSQGDLVATRRRLRRRRLEAFAAPTTASGSTSAPAAVSPPSSSDVSKWAKRVVEKIKTATTFGRMRILPYLNDLTGETAEMRVAYRTMLREPTLKSALHQKVLSVASQGLQVHPEDKDDPDAVLQAEFDLYALRQIAGGGERKIVWSVFSGALMDGWSLSEEVWATQPVQDGKWAGKRIWSDFKPKDTEGLDLIVDDYNNVEGVSGPGIDGQQTEYAMDDFVLYSYQSFFENPFGLSDFRAGYRAFWIKDTAWKMRGLHLDKFTSPYLKGTYTGDEQRVALEAELENARGSNFITVPTGVMVDAIDLSMRGTADFESAIKDCDREMLIGTLGAYLQTMEGSTPNGRGDTGIHKETSELFQWLLSEDAADIMTLMCYKLNKHNFANPKRSRVTLGTVSQSELEAKARVMKALQEVGLKFSKRATYEEFGTQEPADETDVLVPPLVQQGAFGRQQGIVAGAAGADVSSTALNGAQVSSLLDIIDRLAAKQLPASAAVSIILAAFPGMPAQTVQDIVASMAAFKPPAGALPVVPNSETPPGGAAAEVFRERSTGWGYRLNGDSQRRTAGRAVVGKRDN